MSYYVSGEDPILEVPIYQITSEKQTIIEKWSQWVKALFVVDNNG